MRLTTVANPPLIHLTPCRFHPPIPFPLRKFEAMEEVIDIIVMNGIHLSRKGQYFFGQSVELSVHRPWECGVSHDAYPFEVL